MQSIRRNGWLLLGMVSVNLLNFAHAAEPTADVRVMSFNIRYGTAKDAENRWELRREFLVETVRHFGPDLLGTQETLAFQRDFLVEQLDGYAAFGAGRDDGREKGEMAALFYRTERFEKLDGGHFWLSETPEVPGSKSWDSSLTRITTWVKLRDRQNSQAPPLVFVNTHFDHRGKLARVRSAELIRQRIEELPSGTPVILTGDFNAGEASPPYDALFGAHDSATSPLVDAFRMLHSDRGTEEGTFSGFRAGSTTGPRIDWIACSRHWTIQSAEIDRTQRDGRTPSDHFPVNAVLSLK